MENPFNTDNTPKRSTLLTVLLILTFIWSGISFVSNTYVSLALDQVIGFVEDAVDDDAMAGLAKTLEQSIKTMEKTGPIGFGLTALLALISLVGAILMWKLNPRGFHLYATANIVLLFVPMMFGTVKFPGVFETAVTALFIWLYARELKVFTKTSNEQE